jgi:Subtilase family
MPDPVRRLILGNGERYAADIEKRSVGGPREMPRPFEEARSHLRSQTQSAMEKLASLPTRKRLADEAVFCLRLHPDMMAKTYDPKAVFALVRDLENVGSRNYRVPSAEVAQTKRIKKQLEHRIQDVTGRLVFIRSNDAGFRRFIHTLALPESQLPPEFKQDIQRVERFDLLTAAEQLLGFDPAWSEGRVEIVLHPSRYSQDEQKHFLTELLSEHEVSWADSRIATYPNGPLFASCRLTRAAINAIAGANPLRTAHPLIFGGIEDFRNAPTFPAPPPPEATTRSTIKVGMFDGGINPDHQLLKGHTEEDLSLSIKAPSLPEFVAHGIAVAGVMLYGPLNEKDTKRSLPQPAVFVVSIRALPTSNPKDIDLYESIDIIEAAVPARPDIKVFNISFGPRGPICEDTISRFTYSLDTLAASHKVTFFVAAGNDGEAGSGLDRIQAPADMVNGLGIGAYTERRGNYLHAPYSCKGPGRECAKVKPDLVAFGGCEQQPIHLVSSSPGLKLLSRGASFASPFGAAMGAQATEGFDRGTALSARALLIHTASHPDSKPDNRLGHTIVGATLDDIVRCSDREVTVIFQGDLLPTKMVRLPIMLPVGLLISGKVTIRWTVAALPPVSANHPSDYTCCCIEDTFYPNTLSLPFLKS